MIVILFLYNFCDLKYGSPNIYILILYVRFEVFTAVNNGILPQHYMMSQPGRPQLDSDTCSMNYDFVLNFCNET
jgi:hypothetical protein